MGFFDCFDYGGIFFGCGVIDVVMFVDMLDWVVCWYFDYVQFVDFGEFFGFGGCGVGYVVKFGVKLEIVLEGD